MRTVSKSEAEKVAALARSLSVDMAQSPDWAARQARMSSRKLPTRVLEQLLTFRELGTDLGALVLRGLTVGPVNATPANNSEGTARCTQMGRTALLIASALGDPIGYEAEGNGHLIQDMVPAKKLAHTQQSQGSRVDLEVHTEQMFSPLRPDWVVLACLRGDPDAKTYLFTARQLCEALTLEEINALREPRWATTIDESFQSLVPDPQQVRGPMPILSGPVDDPTIVFDQDLIRGLDPEAERLKERIIEINREKRNHHVLMPGDIAILDNSRAIHGRSSFSPKFDGSDRFIARLMAVRDRYALRQALLPDGRTVAARFS